MKATFGGNSGYVGYSESVRSARAKSEGRFPKTLFKKHYSISEKKFKELEERGVIGVSEWHHTSKYGNKTEFYAIENRILFCLLTDRKAEAYKLYIASKPVGTKIQNNKRSRENASNFLNEAAENYIGKVEIGENIVYKGVEMTCYHKTKHRKLPCFKFVKK